MKVLEKVFILLLLVGFNIVLANFNILKEVKNVDKRTINNIKFGIKSYNKRDDCHLCSYPCDHTWCCDDGHSQCCQISGQCSCCSS